MVAPRSGLHSCRFHRWPEAIPGGREFPEAPAETGRDRAPLHMRLGAPPRHGRNGSILEGVPAKVQAWSERPAGSATQPPKPLGVAAPCAASPATARLHPNPVLLPPLPCGRILHAACSERIVPQDGPLRPAMCGSGLEADLAASAACATPLR